MKKTFFLMLALIVSTSLFAQKPQPTTNKTKLLVYYFHITNRCNTCRSIETLTTKVLNETYKTELDSGIIIFQSFNVDLPENKELCKKYDAYGATLALTKIENNKETKIDDLTQFAFPKVHTEDIFIKELKEKINEQLK